MLLVETCWIRGVIIWRLLGEKLECNTETDMTMTLN